MQETFVHPWPPYFLSCWELASFSYVPPFQSFQSESPHLQSPPCDLKEARRRTVLRDAYLFLSACLKTRKRTLMKTGCVVFLPNNITLVFKMNRFNCTLTTSKNLINHNLNRIRIHQEEFRYLHNCECVFFNSSNQDLNHRNSKAKRK